MLALSEDLYARLSSGAETVIEPERSAEFTHSFQGAEIHEMTSWISEWKAEEKILQTAAQRKQELDRRAERLVRADRDCQNKMKLLEQKGICLNQWILKKLLQE